MITVVGPQWELPDVLARSVQRFGLASEVRATGRPPSGQNARLRGGIEKETAGATLVFTRHSPRNSHCAPTRRALEERSRAARRTPTTEVRNKALWR